MQDKLVSVIVPIYNVEPYLERCLDSVLVQTYESLEIILVNDGSPDNCGRICEEYQKKDDRIKVIHRENGGLSAARNSGLDIATGKYIGFVDPDDWIEPNMYEHMMSVMAETDSDIVYCGRFVHRGDSIPARTEANRKVQLQSYNDFNSMLEAFLYKIIPGLQFYLYDAKIWSDLRLAEGFYHQDSIVFPEVISRCKKLTQTSARLYHYTVRCDNITNKKKTLTHLKSHEKVINTYSQLSKENPDVKSLAAFLACGRICKRSYWHHSAKKANFISSTELKVINKSINEIFKDCFKDARKSDRYKNLSKSWRLYWWIYYVSPFIALYFGKIIRFTEKHTPKPRINKLHSLIYILIALFKEIHLRLRRSTFSEC